MCVIFANKSPGQSWPNPRQLWLILVQIWPDVARALASDAADATDAAHAHFETDGVRNSPSALPWPADSSSTFVLLPLPLLWLSVLPTASLP